MISQPWELAEEELDDMYFTVRNRGVMFVNAFPIPSEHLILDWSL
jgi:hypothetical protein